VQVGEVVGREPIQLLSRSSLNSIVGGSEPPASLVEVRESSGFDWGDALVGALVTLALALMAFGSARLIAQRRSTVESQA